MKINRGSVKFLTKILALATLILAGYLNDNRSNSPAQKGAVDLIIIDNGDQKQPDKKVDITKNPSV